MYNCLNYAMKEGVFREVKKVYSRMAYSMYLLYAQRLRIRAKYR